MATNELVLSRPLCFICCKLGKIDVKSLKSIVIDFFSPEDISEAKSQMDDVG